nr:inositol monophosphatase family protein [Roseicitreum antarcticum]
MMLNRNNLDAATTGQVIALAMDMADAARPASLGYFRRADLVADNKASLGAFDPVTAADRAVEDALRAIIADCRPQDGILGEERAGVDSQSGLTWVLDPIDGTRAFLSGAPTWGVLIGLADAQGPFLGVIDQPFIGERFVGGLGQCWTAGPSGRHPLATRPGRDLSQAILFSTFPEVGTAAERAAFQRVADACQLTRYGMDCYAYALLAAGQIDLVVEAGLHPYDIAAPLAVIEAAGGIVTNWQGGPVTMADGGQQVLAAANAEVHAQALALLRG